MGPHYLRDSSLIIDSNAPVEYLGTIIGGPAEVASSRKKAIERTTTTRRGISTLDHAASEVILNRRIADVSNVNYWLRCQGGQVPESTLDQFDSGTREAIEHALGGSIKDHSWTQCTLPVKLGGLGLRSAQLSKLAAFVGSRVAA